MTKFYITFEIDENYSLLKVSTKEDGKDNPKNIIIKIGKKKERNNNNKISSEDSCNLF